MGTVLLVVAIVAAGIAAGVAVVWPMRSTPVRQSWQTTMLGVAATALLAATIRLAWALWQLDFSFEYVSSQSRARSASAYRVAALWGGAEGSLLLFATLLALAVFWAARRHRLRTWGLAVPAVLLTIITATVLVAANPFRRATLPPVRGDGLAPILEHPAMLYHPPILYSGLVATVVPFALALSGRGAGGRGAGGRGAGGRGAGGRLAGNRGGNGKGGRAALGHAAWAAIRRWSLLAWTLLTVGLATGANWAYVELGWGGYWAWDPVENTVLMPWLVLTAAVHVFSRPSVRDLFPGSSLALAMMPFVLVLFGSAVTRSGGLSSVHAFADATAIGYGLGFAVAIGLVATVWWAFGARYRRATAANHAYSAFDTLSAACLSLFMAVVVFMGVGLPLLPGSNRVVPAAFYNRVGAPVLLVTLLSMAVPFASRRHCSGGRTASLLGPAGAAVAVTAAVTAGVDDWFALAIIGFGAAVVVVDAVVLETARTRRLASVVGHIGFVVLALGVVGAAQATVDRAVLAPGQSHPLGEDLTVTFESFVVTDGPRPGSEASTVTLIVADQAGEVATLLPSLVSYPDRAVVLAETSLHSTLRRDVQVVVRTISDDGLAAFDLAVRPWQQFVWWGSAIIALSGIVAIIGTRRRGQSSDVLRLRASSASSVDVGGLSTDAPA